MTVPMRHGRRGWRSMLMASKGLEKKKPPEAAGLRGLFVYAMTRLLIPVQHRRR
jgi:hypothetical protein